MAKHGTRHGKMSQRPRKTAIPTEKRGGITLPTHVWEILEELVAINDAAYQEMGGLTRWWLSDEIRVGMEAHIRDYIREHGPLPASPEARANYIKKVAQANQRKLREELLG